MVFQFFLIGFAVWFIVRMFRQYRKRKVAFIWFLICCLFAFGIVLVSLRPEITDTVARLVGVGRGADLVTYTSLILLFTMVIRLTIALDRIEREMTELVRKLALEQPEKLNSD
ncbi:MAG: DUF2304 domain-containing protein [Patescibacteria group bacterium]